MQLCHREFKRSRLTAAEDVVNLLASGALVLPVLAIVIYFGLCGWGWTYFWYVPFLIVFCSPVVSLLILGAAITTITRPNRIVANRWGLQFYFPFRRRRDLSWKRVRTGADGRKLMRRARGIVAIDEVFSAEQNYASTNANAPLYPVEPTTATSGNQFPVLARPAAILALLVLGTLTLILLSPNQPWTWVFTNPLIPRPKESHNLIIHSPQSDCTVYLMSVVVPSQLASFGELSCDIAIPPQVNAIYVRTDVSGRACIERAEPNRIHCTARCQANIGEDVVLTIALIAPLTAEMQSAAPSILESNFAYRLPVPEQIEGPVYTAVPCQPTDAGSNWVTVPRPTEPSKLLLSHNLIPIKPEKHIAASLSGSLYDLSYPASYDLYFRNLPWKI